MTTPMIVKTDDKIFETPLEAGYSMPARFDPHEQTLVSWPPKEEAVNTDLESFRAEVAAFSIDVAREKGVTAAGFFVDSTSFAAKI